MAKKKISIKDIAKSLGISITTVSFILNGKAKEKRISEDLTKKVEEYIKEVGYKPSHLAQSLRLGKSKVIVFMVEDISNQFFASIARKIEEKAYKNGYKIIYCSTNNDPEKAKALIETFKVRSVDGFIITPTPNLESTITDLVDEDFAVLLFDRWIPSIDCNYVIVENEKSAFEATTHLINNGCNKIGFITVESDQIQMNDRLKGYTKAMEVHGFPKDILMLPFQNPVDQGLSYKIQLFLQKNSELDGLFFATNYLAFEGLQALNTLKKRIPNDMLVVSFDDHYFFKLFQPNISAIEQPLEVISQKLMEGMLMMLDDQIADKQGFRIILPNTLHVRESSDAKK
ncbi:LacI family transcriptional regulator [Aquiflexum sp. LQ15W]|uniref:LacI family DNA-binding transcriptional regulator n=1 Tax=Cognataquiflexum nitidum TaxID=2922272 RepID=UPI001F141266|nr:LacI family DNA-binding transcriptional regulator [Cognataquiflexum nitidum]MCH6199925.1 LacI family transcriptional regulator [Cognataquiflexum nitidum]